MASSENGVGVPGNGIGLSRPKKKKRAPIANLPKGISVGQVTIKGKDYWRVYLGKRFTGGKPVPKHCDTLEEAKQWIFGDAQKHKADSGLSLLELKERAGSSAFELKPAQIAEAVNAYKRLEGLGMTLTFSEPCQERRRHTAQTGQTACSRGRRNTAVKTLCAVPYTCAFPGRNRDHAVRWEVIRELAHVWAWYVPRDRWCSPISPQLRHRHALVHYSDASKLRFRAGVFYSYLPDEQRRKKPESSAQPPVHHGEPATPFPRGSNLVREIDLSPVTD